MKINLHNYQHLSKDRPILTNLHKEYKDLSQEHILLEHKISALQTI